MPATPRKVEVTEKDIKSAKAGNRDYDFNDIEVPGDYEAILVDVSDHTSKQGNDSWKWSFEIMGCPFDEYTSFSKSARWKLIQVLESLGYQFADGDSIENVDPNAFIGATAGAHVDWQDSDTDDEDSPNYREIKWLFPLTEEGESTAPLAEEEPEAI